MDGDVGDDAQSTLDVAFRLGRDEPAERDAFAPAQRAGEVLRIVAAALREIPFGDVHGTGIRRIADLTVQGDAALEAPIEGRARAVDSRELAAGRHLVVIQCRLANRSGECVATFSVEAEASAAAPVGPAAGGTDGIAASEPVQRVDNIPV